MEAQTDSLRCLAVRSTLRYVGGRYRKGVPATMRILHRRLLLTIVISVFASTSAQADINLDLIKGKRTVKDKVSFTIEIDHETNEDPRYKQKPEFIEIHATFASPASGIIALDGRGIQRFDNATDVPGERTEITYGRHTVTLQVSESAVATRLVVSIRGGVVRELIDGAGPSASESTPAAGAARGSNPEERMVDLERRVRQLEAEVEALKKGRRNE